MYSSYYRVGYTIKERYAYFVSDAKAVWRRPPFLFGMGELWRTTTPLSPNAY